MKRSIVIALASLAFTSAALASADGTYTISPGDKREIYKFINLSGSLVIESAQPVEIRWVHTGERKKVREVWGTIELRLPKKIDGHLVVSNNGALPATVRVSERAQVSNPVETWESFWGSAAGGPNSVVNELHRGAKRLLKECFGLCR